MTRPLCSIVAVTFNRADLLRRSIECFNRMRFPLDRLEYVLVDDGSTDDTASLMEKFDSRIDVKYVRIRKDPTVWRDCAVNLNHGIRISTGDNILLTHPEVLFGRDTVVQFCDQMREWIYVCAKPYYLSERDQSRLDTVDWINEGPLAVRKIEGFYDLDQQEGAHPDYTPQSIEGIGKPGGRHRGWQSWVVGGHSRSTMKRLGGHLVSQQWGSTDLLYLSRRNILGIPNLTLIDDSTLCVHQYHGAPRDINKAHAEASTFNLEPQNLKYPVVNNLW